MSLLEGEGVVVLAGLAVSHQVARLLAQPEQRLRICPADRSVVPATENKNTTGNKNEKGEEIKESRAEEMKQRGSNRLVKTE